MVSGSGIGAPARCRPGGIDLISIRRGDRDGGCEGQRPGKILGKGWPGSGLDRSAHGRRTVHEYGSGPFADSRFRQSVGALGRNAIVALITERPPKPAVRLCLADDPFGGDEFEVTCDVAGAQALIKLHQEQIGKVATFSCTDKNCPAAIVLIVTQQPKTGFQVAVKTRDTFLWLGSFLAKKCGSIYGSWLKS